MSDASPRPQRFTRASRLGHRREFAQVYAGRARVESGVLVVHGIPTERPGSRLGLAIGRRVGGAVRRVRLKRMVREAFRLSRPRFPGSYDLVVSARPHDDLGLDAYRTLLVAAVTEIHRLWKRRQERKSS